ncbi:hypothetical protein [Aquimarina sp. 433]
MLKQILKIKGVNQLKNFEKKGIKGGFIDWGAGCEYNGNGCQDPRDVCCNGICLRYEYALAIPNCE